MKMLNLNRTSDFIIKIINFMTSVTIFSIDLFKHRTMYHVITAFINLDQ